MTKKLVSYDDGAPNGSRLPTSVKTEIQSYTQTASMISDLTESVQDILGAFIGGTSGVTVTYDDTGNTFTITGPGVGGDGLDTEAVRDAIGVALIGTGLISVTVNDAADTITISTTATANDTDANLKNRANHTGSQATSTITGLDTALNGKQPLDADLTAIAALASAANKLPYATAPGAWALTDLSAAARTLLDDSDVAAMRATLGLSNVDTRGTMAVTSMASTSPAVDLSQYRMLVITAQAAALNLTTSLTGTGALDNGRDFIVRLKDNGTARAITMGSLWRAVGVTAPTISVAGKTMYLGGKWNATDGKMDLLAIGREA